MIDVNVPGSPGHWLHKAAKKLERRRPRLQVLWDRYSGDAPVPKGATVESTKAYERFRKIGRVAWARKIVNSRRDRMKPVGFFTGADGDPNGDPEAQRMWDRGGMGVEFAEAIKLFLVMGWSYIFLVRASEEGDDGPRVNMTVEDPRQVITIHDPVQQSRVRCALKMFHDDDLETDYAFLQLAADQLPSDLLAVIPENDRKLARVFVATRPRKTASKNPTFSPSAWSWDEDRGGALGQALDVARPQVVTLRNENGEGEFEPHVDLLDGLDQGAFEKRVVSALQAWRQRAAILPDGADEEDVVDPETGEETGEVRKIDWDDILTADPGAVWTMPADTEFWESLQSDLRPQIDSLVHDARVLADVTSTPLRSFATDAAGGSAEGAASQREDLVFVVEDRIGRATEAARDILAMAFELIDDKERAKRELIRVQWTPPDRRSITEIGDAWSKTDGMNPALRYRIIVGLTPTEIAEVQADDAAIALEAAAAARAATAAANPPAPTGTPRLEVVTGAAQ